MTYDLAVSFLALLFSCFVVGVLLGVAFSPPIRKAVKDIISKIVRRDIELSRVFHNPVIRPGSHPWTAEAVFNPGALALGGRTHLMYRAIGSDGISRLGYASSGNGIVFDDRYPSPAYVAQNPRAGFPGPRRYSPVMYASGGSWGGCEDPRIVSLNGRVYVSFNAFDGWDFVRIAVISIAEHDFLAKRFWRWSMPTLISPPGQIHKNWVLFPEKINGKIAILHSVSPEVEVAYRDSVEGIGRDEPFVESWVGPRDSRPMRIGSWDNYMRGAGPPPLKTKDGWLLFYHAIDARDPGRYKLGAMLLDLYNPSKILYRSSYPVLSPDTSYENEGKPGIVYACGAVIRDDTLYIYYGGADKVVCVAYAHLPTFLAALKNGEHPALSATPAQTA